MSGLAPSLDALVGRARALARSDGPAILGVAGAPGAGNSTVAARIVAALPSAVLVPMDGFHLANAELDRLGRREWKGAPDTFDAAGYVALLRRLRQPDRDPVYAPEFDRHLEEAIAGAIRVEASVPLVVTEGNYLLLDGHPWGQVRELLDEAWYVEIDDQVRVERLVARHIDHGKEPRRAREWVLRSDEANARLVRETRHRADLIVHQASGT